VKKAIKKTVKKSAPKKVVKKAAKKVAAKKAVKKAAPKKVVKKVITKKVVAKKTAPKKVSVKKVAPTKVAAKPVVKKVVVKPIAKKVIAPKPAAKPVVKAKAAATESQPKFVAHTTHLLEGDKAPHFKGTDQNGNTVDSADLAGKTIILYFYPKDDTPGCTATACSLRDEYRYLNEANYAVIGVSADDEASHKKFAEKFHLPFPLLADTNHEVMKAYGVWGPKQFMGRIFDGIIRTTFIIDGDGTITKVIKNVDTANHAEQILAK
jgi:thioredoxin-dependent peroxiredoxin